MQSRRRVACLAVWIASVGHAPAAAQSAESVAAALRLLATVREQHVIEPIGLTATGRRIMALEPAQPPVANQRRVVIVGGLDGSAAGARVVLDVLRAGVANGTAFGNRRRWQVAAVPCVLPDRCDRLPDAPADPAGPPAIAFPPEKGYYDAPEFREARYLWRWVSMLGPDLVIEVGHGDRLEWRANALAREAAGSVVAAPDSLAGALGVGAPSGLAPVAALQVSGPPREVVAAVRALLERRPAPSPSPMHRAITERQARAPLEMARLLAATYPASPIMSYIPALSWSGALRVSSLTADPQYRNRAVEQMQPFVSGAKPAIAEPYLLTSLAGHQALFDLADAERDADASVSARKGADVILGRSPDEMCALPRRGPTTCSWRRRCSRGPPRLLASRGMPRPLPGCSPPMRNAFSATTGCSSTP